MTLIIAVASTDPWETKNLINEASLQKTADGDPDNWTQTQLIGKEENYDAFTHCRMSIGRFNGIWNKIS